MMFPVRRVTTANAYDQYYYSVKKVFFPLLYEKKKISLIKIIHREKKPKQTQKTQ